jgi:adenosylcobinamide-phosphate synthase
MEQVVDRSLVLIAAALLDAVVGDPAWAWRRIPHPVVLIGRLIGLLDRTCNHGPPALRLALGGFTTVIVVGLAAGVGAGITAAAGNVAWGIVIEILVVTVLIAQRDLFDHVRRVAGALDQGLDQGRQAVSQIVGRDPMSLDQHGVARAAIESLFENFSDGVVAPMLWYLAFGLPGICAYKALNTADSMIGHRSLTYLHFGRVAARADDLANLIPARVAGLVIVVASVFVPSAKPWAALKTMVRDAGKHRSPNAGWPEAAAAGALDLSLAGPRRYGLALVDDPWLGHGRARADARDIRRGLALFVVACGVLVAGIVGAALATA